MQGRAGRTQPGIAWRLYSRQLFDALPSFTPPEAQRQPLESLILQIFALPHRSGAPPNPRTFPFLDPPPPLHIHSALVKLHALGAVVTHRYHDATAPAAGAATATAQGEGGKEGSGNSSADNHTVTEEALSPLGQFLCTVPVDPGIGRLLVLGALFGCVEEALVIAAGLSVGSIWKWRGQQSRSGGGSGGGLGGLEDIDGDTFSVMKAFDQWCRQRQRAMARRKGSGHGREGRGKEEVGVKPWCLRHGVVEQRLFEMARLITQYRGILKRAGLLGRR